MAWRREIERRRPRIRRGQVSCRLDAMVGPVEPPPDRDRVSRCVGADVRPARLSRKRANGRLCPRLRGRDVARCLDDGRGPFALRPDGRRVAVSIHGQARAGGSGSGEHRRRHRNSISGPPLLATGLERPEAAPQQRQDNQRAASAVKVHAHRGTPGWDVILSNASPPAEQQARCQDAPYHGGKVLYKNERRWGSADVIRAAAVPSK
jgi:hypothetical protein